MGAFLDLRHDSVSARASFAELIAQGDPWRRSPASAGGPPGHKEWSHFCVFGDGITLLANLSLMDAAHGAGASIEVPRLTLLARTPDGWAGDVDAFAPGAAAVAGGEIDLRLGASRLAFRGGAYHLDVRLARRDLAAKLVLRPLARPALTTSVPLSGSAPMRWFVVPRLVADGELRVNGRRHALRGAPAYHDHDWGDFAWGGDFSWEWAVTLAPPSDAPGERPWSLVFQRISDRGRLRALSQGVLLWRGERHVRTFHDRDLAVASGGRLSAAGALRVPRPMALVAPGHAADLPRRLELRAADGADAIEATFELQDLAQVAIPDDALAAGPAALRPAVTIVSECHAVARVAGRLRGEPLHFEAPAVVELNRGAA
jgi:hypothetical protein